MPAGVDRLEKVKEITNLQVSCNQRVEMACAESWNNWKDENIKSDRG